jgi:hypothetical protein
MGLSALSDFYRRRQNGDADEVPAIEASPASCATR